MTELMKEIKDYWNTRTEGYSEVNEKEASWHTKRSLAYASEK